MLIAFFDVGPNTDSRASIEGWGGDVKATLDDAKLTTSYVVHQ